MEMGQFELAIENLCYLAPRYHALASHNSVALSYSTTGRQYPPVLGNPWYKRIDSEYVPRTIRIYCTQDLTPDGTTVPRRQIRHQQRLHRCLPRQDIEHRVLSPTGPAGRQYGVGEDK